MTIPEFEPPNVSMKQEIFLAAVARHAADLPVTRKAIGAATGRKQQIYKIDEEDFDAISESAKTFAETMTSVRAKRSGDDMQRTIQNSNETIEKQRQEIKRQRHDMDLLRAYVSQIHDASESEILDEAISQGAKKTSMKGRVLNAVPDLPTNEEEEVR